MGLPSLAIVGVLALTGALPAQAAGNTRISGSRVLAPVAEWPGYLQNGNHTSFNGAETYITSASAPSLAQRWSFATSAPISAEPIQANGLVYTGSWDGNERALTRQGQLVWSTFLGQTTDNLCNPTTVGVASTPTVSSVTPGTILSTRSTLYVGGGDGQIYALDARTGAILWHTRLGPSPSTFIWSSPTLYGGSVYIGVASYGDCPLVQGQLVRLDAATGAVQSTFNVVPTGCTGAGVWGTPTVDANTGIVYFATGNGGSCSSSETYAVSLVAVHASDLSLVSSWQIPPAQQVPDGDFGSTPTLFSATISGSPKSMVGIIGKNGFYYSFDRTAIGNGPVWQARIAAGGSCPECGYGPIAPAAWDGQQLYVGGTIVTLNGQSCRGSLQALDPATGHANWALCLSSGSVLGAVAAVPGVVFAGAGSKMFAYQASNGKTLFTFTDPAGKPFYSAASIAGGQVYVGNVDGALYCFVS